MHHGSCEGPEPPPASLSQNHHRQEVVIEDSGSSLSPQGSEVTWGACCSTQQCPLLGIYTHIHINTPRHPPSPHTHS